jgi:CRISPR-associated protein Cas1
MAFLYLTEQGSVLQKTGERLLVIKDEQTLLDIPAAKVEGVLVFGNVQFTTQAAQLLLQQGVEMALFTRRGRLVGQLTSPFTKNIVLRQAQYQRATDPVFALVLAKIIVKAKLTNSRGLLQEFARNHPDTGLKTEIERLSELIALIKTQSDLSALLGLEGRGAHTYFLGFARMVRHSFGFSGRERHPAPDPVNALLSLGYTLAYNEISSLLDGMGFDPYMGFYHQPRYGHATLASDLLEEFRALLVDRLTLSLINTRVFGEEDFFRHDPSGGIYLLDEPRKRYFQEYERYLNEVRHYPQEGTESNFRRIFRRQAERLMQAVLLKETYQPYTFSW